MALQADYFGGRWAEEDPGLGPFLILAVAVHVLVLFLVGFAWRSLPQEDPPPAFDVTLVNTRSQTPPEAADYLAQAAQSGGGNTEEKVRPTTVAPAAMPRPQPVESALTPPSDPALPQRRASPPLLTSPAGRQVIEHEEEVGEREEQRVDVARILSRSREIASLEMELGEAIAAYSRQPRERFITAATKEYRYAAYLDAWRRKVEQVGNLNYPEEARRQGLSGSLILDVALNPDGSVREISVVRSSGSPVLDQAAIRIVRLAAPFAPFPESIRKETDVLHITRTWRFMSGGTSLSTQ